MVYAIDRKVNTERSFNSFCYYLSSLSLSFFYLFFFKYLSQWYLPHDYQACSTHALFFLVNLFTIQFIKS